jgi:hypothetical protein
MNFTPSRLDNPAQNVLLWAAWQRAEREQHDTESLLAVVLPDLAPAIREIRFAAIGDLLDLAYDAATTNNDQTLADSYLDDALDMIHRLLAQQAAASFDGHCDHRTVSGPAIAIVR